MKREKDGDSGSGLFPAGGFRVLQGGRRRKNSGDRDQVPAYPCPPPDAALDGRRPVLIVHKPHQHHDQVPELLARLKTETVGKLALGVCSWLPDADAGAHRSYNSSFEAAEIRIVDPRAYRASGHDLVVKKVTDDAAKRAPYLRDDTFPLATLLDMQREGGANLLLTFGRALNPSDSLGSLAAARAEWDEALTLLKPGERLAINVTVSAEWLKQPQLLDDLLAELIEDRAFTVWHVRVQWLPPAKSWHQPTTDKLLVGYRTLAQTAYDEGRRLLLPQTGLTGWLTLAWGAAGYGTGTFGSIQAFLEEKDTKGGKQLERYFERQLLHFAERPVHHALTRDRAYQTCKCPYCGPLLAGTSWAHKDAGLHYLHAMGMLTAEVSHPGSACSLVRAAVAAKVGAAVRFAKEKDKYLTNHSNPAHLDTWDRLLSS